MTLTKFMARSTWVAHAFEWEKLLKCHLKGKTSLCLLVYAADSGERLQDHWSSGSSGMLPETFFFFFWP